MKAGMFRFALAFSAAIAAASVKATDVEFVWIGGASTDWTLGANYSNTVTGTTGALPGSGDILTIPDNTTAKLVTSDTASLDVFNTLKLISPDTVGSWLEVEVPEGGDVLIAPEIHYKGITGQGHYTYAYTRGGIIKTGLGTLKFPAYHVVCYCCKVVVNTGALRFGVDAPANRYYMFADLVQVEKGATFYMPDGAGTVNGYFSNFAGEGDIRYSGSSTTYIAIRRGASESPYLKTFRGRILDRVGVKNQGSSYEFGTNNLSTAAYWYVGDSAGRGLNGPVAYIRKFGMLDSGEPSTLGNAGIYFFGWTTDQGGAYYEDSGYMRYIGEGETTDKPFRLGGNSAYPDTIDAGEYGGLHLIGEIKADSASEAQSQTGYMLVLTGDEGAAESSVTGSILNGKMTNGDKAETSITNITKRGAMTWKFAPGNITSWNGEFVLEEGTAKFVKAPNNTLLKNGTVFEFDGSDAITESAGRTIRVEGGATIRNATGRELRIGAVEAVGEGAVLTVDVAEGSKVILIGAKDGEGTLSIVKTGAGDLELDGEQSFSGGFEARAGKAKVVRPKYSYFRLTVRESWYYYGGFYEICFWDADGNRHGSELTPRLTELNLKPTDIAEGEMGPTFIYQTPTGSFGTPHNDRDITSWFDGTSGNQSITYYFKNVLTAPVKSDPNTWYTYTFHFPRNTPAIAYYDFATLYQSDKTNYCGCKSSILEGSADGVNWDTLCETDMEAPEKTCYYWGVSLKTSAGFNASNITGYDYANDAAKLATGPSLDVFNNVESVKLGAGAEFETDDGYELSRIAVDAADTVIASYKGFRFASSGRIDIDHAGASRLLAVDVSQATGTANLENWQVYSGGVLKTGWKVSIKNGQLYLTRPGLVISID